MKTTLFTIAVLSMANSTMQAQINHTRTLDRNNVSCVIGDEGAFFNRTDIGAAYEIPKGTGRRTMYAASIWVAAQKTSGEVCFSGGYATNSSEIHSGPIANPALYNSMDYSNQYSESIWMISSQDISSHILLSGSPGYTPPPVITNWPGNGNTALGVANKLAPYIDVNNNNIYDPVNGDYPDIRGDKAVYVIMNDKSYNPDNNSMGIEIHAMFYQFSSGNYLNNTTFLNLKVINRSNTNYVNYRQSIYADFDIGHHADDAFGSYPPNHLIFGYNGDNYDEPDGNTNFYGENPPCQGIVSLSHPMYSSCYYTNSSQSPYGDYQSDQMGKWHFMNGRWADGSPFLYGGLGYPGSNGVTNSTTMHLFSGNPNNPDEWHEVSANIPSGDRRGLLTIAENSFPPGSSICSEFAFIYDKSSSHLNNVQNVINIAGALRNLYQTQFPFVCNSTVTNSVEELNTVSFNVYPNPTSGTFNIELAKFDPLSILTIQDISGRTILQKTIQAQLTPIELKEAPGVYIIGIKNGKDQYYQRLILE